MEEQQGKEHPEQPYDPEEITPEDIARRKRQARLNALLLGGVFFLTVMAPHPWNTYAPLLFLIPLVYSVVKKVRKATEGMDPLKQQSRIDFGAADGPREEPYSCTPRDPRDPRRYKPIE